MKTIHVKTASLLMLLFIGIGPLACYDFKEKNLADIEGNYSGTMISNTSDNSTIYCKETMATVYIRGEKLEITFTDTTMPPALMLDLIKNDTLSKTCLTCRTFLFEFPDTSSKQLSKKGEPPYITASKWTEDISLDTFKNTQHSFAFNTDDNSINCWFTTNKCTFYFKGSKKYL